MQKLFWPPEFTKNKEIVLGLERMKALLTCLGHPENKLPPVIHIAGTNGKGSTLAFVKYILKEEGYSAHRYISPHLVEFNERIEITGKEITDKYLTELLEECKKTTEENNLEITFFEGTTATAILGFSRNKADIVLLETGLGGRLDATNVIDKPEVTVISSISIDHVAHLGNTPQKIAFEKAGIIKENCPVVVSKQEFPGVVEVFEKVAKEKNAKIYVFGKDWIVKKENDDFVFEGFGEKIKMPKLSLVGDHQYMNAGTSIATLFVQKKLKISRESIIKGLQTTKWPARMQNISDEKPIKSIFKNNKNDVEIWLDGGHNEDAMKKISDFIRKENKTKKRKTITIVRFKQDKDFENSIKQIKDDLDFGISTVIKHDWDSVPLEKIEETFKKFNIENAKSNSFTEALELISKKYQSGDLRIIICGSLYLAGDVLEYIKQA